jgi:hypothetical protein
MTVLRTGSPVVPRWALAAVPAVIRSSIRRRCRARRPAHPNRIPAWRPSPACFIADNNVSPELRRSPVSIAACLERGKHLKWAGNTTQLSIQVP